MQHLLPAAAFGLGAGYLALIFRMPVGTVEDPVGPRMFPMLIAIGIVLCSVFMWRERRSASDGATAELLADEPVDPALRRRQTIAILAVSLATLVYVVLLEPIGYLLASFLLLTGLLLAFHRGHTLVNLLIAAGLSITLYVGLKNFLGVSLPDGFLDAFLG